MPITFPVKKEPRPVRAAITTLIADMTVTLWQLSDGKAQAARHTQDDRENPNHPRGHRTRKCRIFRD